MTALDRRLVVILAWCLACVVPAAAAAQGAPPSVDVVVSAEVPDATGWLALHQEVLGSGPDSPNPLRVSLAAGTGTARGLQIEQPKFTAVITVADGRRVVKVGISGKITPAEALASLGLFQQAAVEVQAGAMPNQLTLAYGLSVVSAQLVELQVARP